MITGQNSEVVHDELAFHVQTEDKGRDNPMLESLVYLGGQVLACTRTSYADELEEGCTEEDIAGLLDRQHQVMIAAVERGRFDDKVRELGESTPGGLAAASEESAPPPEAPGPTLDEVVLDYLVNREEGETLKLALEGDVQFRSGEEVEIVLAATATRAGTPMSDVVIDVKMICSLRPPEVLGMGHTDLAGRAFVRIFIPPDSQGAAALIVTATSVIGGAELKFLL